MQSRTRVAPAITTMATTNIRMALSTVLFGMVRPRTWVFSLPRSLFRPRSPMTAAVVILMPPPQLPGFAPMNMMMIKKNSDACVRSGMFTELSPAVRLVNAMNSTDCAFSPMVWPLKRLFHSVKEKMRMLARMTMMVPYVAMRVCNETRRISLCLKSKM